MPEKIVTNSLRLHAVEEQGPGRTGEGAGGSAPWRTPATLGAPLAARGFWAGVLRSLSREHHGARRTPQRPRCRWAPCPSAVTSVHAHARAWATPLPVWAGVVNATGPLVRSGSVAACAQPCEMPGRRTATVTVAGACRNELDVPRPAVRSTARRGPGQAFSAAAEAPRRWQTRRSDELTARSAVCLCAIVREQPRVTLTTPVTDMVCLCAHARARAHARVCMPRPACVAASSGARVHASALNVLRDVCIWGALGPGGGGVPTESLSDQWQGAATKDPSLLEKVAPFVRQASSCVCVCLRARAAPCPALKMHTLSQ